MTALHETSSPLIRRRKPYLVIPDDPEELFNFSDSFVLAENVLFWDLIGTLE